VRHLGIREWVGIAILVAALGLAFVFFDPTSSEGSGRPSGTILLGDTPVPTATPTQTPVRVHAAAAPANGWQITYFQQIRAGSDVRDSDTVVPTLDLNYSGPAFPDLKDDAWSVQATGAVNVEPGRSSVTFETDGAVRILINGSEALKAGDEDGVRKRRVEFDSAGGTVTVQVEVRDTGGPLVLRWSQ
jgi:hypothetical protein